MDKKEDGETERWRRREKHRLKDKETERLIDTEREGRGGREEMEKKKREK